tara:strand:- start:96 stop:1190 length:1095 start_codon:yes stop_codon:yes gene_type:complete
MYRKNSADLAEDYNFDENIIIDTPSVKVKKKKGINKLHDDDFFIPLTKQYEIINTLNYNVKQLKNICKHYKQKQSGNKNEIKKRIYTYLKESHYIIKLQRFLFKVLYNKYKKVKGPINMKRDNCTNETDFITLQKIKDIPYYSLFSYKSDTAIYGYHIASLFNYIMKTNKNPNEKLNNPYDRSNITTKELNNIHSFIKLSKIFKLPITLDVEEDEIEYSETEIIKNKTLELFQLMDGYGHYTDVKWFLNLDVRRLIRYIRELNDIWEYRAQLSSETKKSIHYPNGTPFTPLYGTFTPLQNHNRYSLPVLQKIVLEVIQNMVTKGINEEYKNLGAFYVLGAFTLVNSDAASALPWLYESVMLQHL